MEQPPMPASMMSGAHNTIGRLQEKIDKQQALIDELAGILNEIVVTCENSDAWWMDCPDRGGIDVDKIEELITKAKKEATNG